jgi:hypothetical protein
LQDLMFINLIVAGLLACEKQPRIPCMNFWWGHRWWNTRLLFAGYRFSGVFVCLDTEICHHFKASCSM